MLISNYITPVMFTDSTGFITENTRKIVIGVGIIATLAFFTVVSAGTIGAGLGAILSTLTGTGVGGLTGILASATVSSTVTALIGGVLSGSINKLQGGNFEDGFSQGFMMGAITGGLAGGLGAGLSSSIKNTFASHAFMNGNLSMTIKAVQAALTNTFSFTDTVISFGFGYFGGGFFRNMYGLKSIGTGLGLSLGEAGVGHLVHEVFPNALFTDFRFKLVGGRCINNAHIF